MNDILKQIAAERRRQLKLWGRQKLRRRLSQLEQGTFQSILAVLKEDNDNTKKGRHKWANILLEEVYEAITEKDRSDQATELVQVAAVCVAWIEDLRGS